MFSRERMTAPDGEETKDALCPPSLLLLSASLYPPSSPFPVHLFFLLLIPLIHFPWFIILFHFPQLAISPLFPSSSLLPYRPLSLFFQVFQSTLLKSDLSLCLWRQIQLGCQGFGLSRSKTAVMSVKSAPV